MTSFEAFSRNIATLKLAQQRGAATEVEIDRYVAAESPFRGKPVRLWRTPLRSSGMFSPAELAKFREKHGLE